MEVVNFDGVNDVVVDRKGLLFLVWLVFGLLLGGDKLGLLEPALPPTPPTVVRALGFISWGRGGWIDDGTLFGWGRVAREVEGAIRVGGDMEGGLRFVGWAGWSLLRRGREGGKRGFLVVEDMLWMETYCGCWPFQATCGRLDLPHGGAIPFHLHLFGRRLQRSDWLVLSSHEACTRLSVGQVTTNS